MGVKPTARRRSKRLFIVGIIITCLGLLVAGFLIRQTLFNDSFSKVPTFPTVSPKTKSIETLGGWKRVSPPGKDPVFAYTDSIDGVPIIVSQQALPSSFSDNREQKVAELAKKFNATKTVEVGNTKMYLGTSAKGPQSAIVAKNNILILIKSERKISDKAWVSYLQTLN